MRNLIKLTLVFLLLFTFTSSELFAQIIAPTGTNKAASQMIYYYDQDSDNTRIQIVNTNDTEGVWIHVQIFRSYDADNDDDGMDLVFCDERNFVDFLTPNDTHVYILGDDPFNKNMGENETDLGEEVNIDLDQTKGFVVITPVVSEADLSAISFQHLIGNFNVSGMDDYTISQRRDAVDFTTGEILPDGTVLDGVTGGYVLIQPEELIFNLGGSSGVEIVPIAFNDNYGPAGLLGYQVIPAEVTWNSFIFDFKEDPTSCGVRQINCFDALGINDEDFTQHNPIFGNNQRFLCEGTDLPDDPGDFGDESGWVRIFVSGLGENTNHFGLFGNDDYDDFEWMFVRGERTEIDPEPVPEVCDDEAMADEDEDGFANCLDSDCATAENCETGEGECADEMDNDGDGDTDCADLGCDGFDNCEFGEETLCDDGIDNDADGAVDGDDTDCQVADTGGDGGDGGGCNVAGTVTTATAAANFLLPLLPLAGVYGYRRLRRRSSK